MTSKETTYNTLHVSDEHYEVTIVDKTGDETIESWITMLRGALVALTFSPKLVDEYLGEEY